MILADQTDKDSELAEGQYMIVHASAIELKRGNSRYGLYPVEGNWFYDDIKTIYDESKNRYLRYICGDKAVRFNQIANLLQTINKDRNDYFCKQVLGDLADEQIINLSHYGMPTTNSVCIGCQWEQQDYTLLTSPGNDIFLVHPDLTKSNTIQVNNKILTLTPHGCGVRLKNPVDRIVYTEEGIQIGNKHFRKGESINIGNDVIVRTYNSDDLQLRKHINSILEKCPGQVYCKMHQLFARTKYGDVDYTNRDLEEYQERE